MANVCVIMPYLMTYRAEVKGMLLTEYNEAAAMELFKEDGIREGMQKGMQKGILQILTRLVKEDAISLEKAAKEAGMTTDEFAEEMNKVQA